MGPQRTAIPNPQRAALRAWVRSSHPRPTLVQARKWYEQQYHHKLSISTVGESLSEKYVFLDSPAELPPTAGSRKPKFLTQTKSRIRPGEWPDLERALILWHEAVTDQGGVITGDILQEKAGEIWDRLPSSQGKNKPVFSSGWLTGFKARHGLYQHTFHGEEGAVPAAADEAMTTIHDEVRYYNERDIFNMDETGLFWRLAPSTGLSSQRRGGIKKDKARISLALCCNANGTERMPPFVIGKARIPHALRGVNMSTLGVRWHSNSNAWMTGPIMKVWLEEFYLHVGQRRVLLLLDNFSAHNTGLAMAPPPGNVQVLFLPPNATSRYQPLDQGIIQNFKVYYKKQWLQFMVKHWQEQQDPMKEMNIHIALRWIIRAWHMDISSLTIRNCYRRSTILASPDDGHTPALQHPNLTEVFYQAQQVGNVQNRMTLSNFLNPEDEQVVEAIQDPMEMAINTVIDEGQESQEYPDYDDSQAIEPSIPDCTIKEAYYCLERFTKFIEKRPDGRTTHLIQLADMERYLDLINEASLRQGTIDSWLQRD